MYSPLLFQVISRSCFRFAPAAPFIIISTYILRCLLITIHARGSIQLIYHLIYHSRIAIFLDDGWAIVQDRRLSH